ncbi:MAG: hypothetical protein R2772_03220 [Chitinophagales bacterium]
MAFPKLNSFEYRHIGISNQQEKDMLEKIGVQSLDELIEQTVPRDILIEDLALPEGISEYEYTRND